MRLPRLLQHGGDDELTDGAVDGAGRHIQRERDLGDRPVRLGLIEEIHDIEVTVESGHGVFHGSNCV